MRFNKVNDEDILSIHIYTRLITNLDLQQYKQRTYKVCYKEATVISNLFAKTIYIY